MSDEVVLQRARPDLSQTVQARRFSRSTSHFRASFESLAGNICVVFEPIVHSAATLDGQFKNLGRKLYPEGNL